MLHARKSSDFNLLRNSPEFLIDRKRFFHSSEKLFHNILKHDFNRSEARVHLLIVRINDKTRFICLGNPYNVGSLS